MWRNKKTQTPLLQTCGQDSSAARGFCAANTNVKLQISQPHLNELTLMNYQACPQGLGQEGNVRDITSLL